MLAVSLSSSVLCSSSPRAGRRPSSARQDFSTIAYKLNSPPTSPQAESRCRRYRMGLGSRCSVLRCSSTARRRWTSSLPAIRANVIEGLLDPTLTRVQVADTSSLPAAQRTVRVRNVETYFAVNGLGSVLVPAGAGQADAGPEGLTITISVCPPPNDRIGYGICLLSPCAARRDGASSLRHHCPRSR